MPRKLRRPLRPNESKSRAKNERWKPSDNANERSVAANEAEAVVVGEPVEAASIHVDSETLADLPRAAGLHPVEVVPAMLTRMPHVVAVEVDLTVVVAPDRGLPHDLCLAHHRGEDVVTALATAPPRQDHPVLGGEEEALIFPDGEIRDLVTDHLDLPHVQINHAHGPPEDVAIPLVHLQKAAAEALRGEEDVHTQARGQDLGLGYEMEDGVMVAGMAVGRDHHRTHPKIEIRPGLISLGAAPHETTVV